MERGFSDPYSPPADPALPSSSQEVILPCFEPLVPSPQREPNSVDFSLPRLVDSSNPLSHSQPTSAPPPLYPSQYSNNNRTRPLSAPQPTSAQPSIAQRAYEHGFLSQYPAQPSLYASQPQLRPQTHSPVHSQSPVHSHSPVHSPSHSRRVGYSQAVTALPSSPLSPRKPISLLSPALLSKTLEMCQKQPPEKVDIHSESESQSHTVTHCHSHTHMNDLLISF